MKKADTLKESWTSPIPEERWRGFRHLHRGVAAFQSLENFEAAQLNELDNSLEDHEKKALGRLLKMGKKDELEIFIRTHGANPISDPHAPINVPIHVAKADMVDLSLPPSRDAHQAILRGEVAYVLFHAGEATRFNRGPLFGLSLIEVAEELKQEFELTPFLNEIQTLRKTLPDKVATFLIDSPLGPKQVFLIRAGLRRVVQNEVVLGRLSVKEAQKEYEKALKQQKIFIFIGQRGAVADAHDEALRSTFEFYGFDPENVVTIEQELVSGLTASEDGRVSLVNEQEAKEAAGHLYAFLQSVRPGGFTTYTPSGRPIKPMEQDALSYLYQRGARYLSIVRINDMDRHSTEIVNAKALGYALTMFKKGYYNVIEGVANPTGQKGGTGTCFDDPEIHCLTETHENSYPALSRAFEAAMKGYVEKYKGHHPAYNAMRQWSGLQQTRFVLREFGGRIVFVPRGKKINGESVMYLGADMPMGDLSLFVGHYKSRMFQFINKERKELRIHDMKRKEDLPIALRTMVRQLKDPYVIATAREFVLKETVPFSADLKAPWIYGAPTPEWDS